MDPVTLGLGAASLASMFLGPKPPIPEIQPNGQQMQLPQSPLGPQVQSPFSAQGGAQNAAPPMSPDLVDAVRFDNSSGQQSILDALKAGSLAARVASTERTPDRSPQSAVQAQNQGAPISPPQQQAQPAQADPQLQAAMQAQSPQAAQGAAQAIGKSKFLGLDSDQWGAIGVASGILARLFQPLPPVHTLTPGGSGPSPLPSPQLGVDAGGGSQRLNFNSQFAINAPNAGTPGSILDALRRQGGY